jgi:hypothetical protein
MELKTCLGIGGRLYKILKKTLHEIVRVRIVKQRAGSYIASQKIKDWAL